METENFIMTLNRHYIYVYVVHSLHCLTQEILVLDYTSR